MSAQTVLLTSFTVFPTLPFELRRMIWEAACWPRVVEIEYDEEEGFTSRCSDPMALRVCKESRETTIPFYPLCFGSIFTPAKTRFNFALDTLYIDNELEENVPHFFSTFGPLEISSLRTLALEDCYNETVSRFEPNITANLHKMVKKLPALRELSIVYDIAQMTDRNIGCTDGHAMQLHAGKPAELVHPSLLIDPLPQAPVDDTDADPHGYRLWGIKIRPVYGWRRCPHAEFDFSDMTEEEQADAEEYGMYGPWGAPPATAIGELFGDFPDSDDMYGFGESDYSSEVDSDDDDEEDDESEVFPGLI